MAAARIDVWSFDIRIGRAVTEELAQPRLEFHRWLSVAFGGLTGVHRNLRPQKGTLYFTFDELRLDPNGFTRYITKVDALRRPAHVVLDLSANKYGLLRDPFLAHVADKAAAWAVAHQHMVIVLLPRHPAKASLFWQPLGEIPRGSRGSVLVFDRTGALRPHGRPTTGWTDEVRKEFIKTQETINPTPTFDEKIVKRLGHFSHGIDSLPNHCGRYMFDASRCKTEVANALTEKICDALGQLDSTTKLVLGHSAVPWMKAVGVLCKKRLGVQMIALGADPPTRAPKELSKTQNVLLLDFVDSGEGLRALVELFERWKRPLARPIFAVFSTTPKIIMSYDDGDLDIDVECVRQERFRGRVEEGCQQCDLGLEPSDPDIRNDALRGLSAYDFWSIVLSRDWIPERYGTPRKLRFKSVPDFPRLFSEHGGWLAFKYDVLLQHLHFGHELVVMCPDEPAVRELLDKLRERFEERLVCVAVPREVLEAAKNASDKTLARWEAEVPEQYWSRQLRHLRGKDQNIVVIDEFNGSNSTMSAFSRLLEHYGVKPAAYMPFWSRTADEEVAGVPTFPLYQVVSPRMITRTT